jgi:phosphosulfolactate synthase (CoM biosynthesis protein A)
LSGTPAGPYSTPVGRHLGDLLETIGAWVDTLKYARGSFALMPRDSVRALHDLCHRSVGRAARRLPYLKCSSSCK